MPVCTSCRHNREIERLRRICAACKGPSSNFGKNVHIDSFADGDIVLKHADQLRLAQSRAATSAKIAGVDDKTAELLMRVVQEFSTLSDTEAPIVARRLRGQENWQIAHEMRLSKFVVYERWKKLKKRNPIWAAIDNGLIGKRRGGRKARESLREYVQPDLF